MTLNEISNLLKTEHVKKSKSSFVYWVSYFYGMNKNADKLIEHVKAKVPNAVIIDSGNHWHEFVGGAKSGSAKDSYLWVRFTVDNIKKS